MGSYIKNIKCIDLEYFFGLILAMPLWVYLLIQTGIISQDIAKDCKIKYLNNYYLLDNYKISGLSEDEYKQVLLKCQKNI